MGVIQDKNPCREIKVPRTFASAAYVLQLEGGLYGLFRDILVETDELREGKIQREKSGRIGPIALLRPSNDPENDNIVMQTFDTESHQVIYLTPVDPETGK